MTRKSYIAIVLRHSFDLYGSKVSWRIHKKKSVKTNVLILYLLEKTLLYILPFWKAKT